MIVLSKKRLAVVLLFVASCQAEPTTILVERLVVSPDSVSVVVGESMRFIATAYQSDGRTVPVVAAWTTSSGTIDQTGLFRASQSGRAVVQAAARGLSAFAVVHSAQVSEGYTHAFIAGRITTGAGLPAADEPVTIVVSRGTCDTAAVGSQVVRTASDGRYGAIVAAGAFEPEWRACVKVTTRAGAKTGAVVFRSNTAVPDTTIINVMVN